MVNSWASLCQDFTPEQFVKLLRLIATRFTPGQEPYNSYLREDEPFDEVCRQGEIELPAAQTVLIGTARLKGELTARSSKRKQYDMVKRILKGSNHNAAIFAFYDDTGRFRLSLVVVNYHGTRRKFSTFRRYTFFVDPQLPNKTFLQQMNKADFSSLPKILETFSLEAVSEEFYNEFKPRFDAMSAAVKGEGDDELKKDFALLFVIRVIFLGFVQKKGWFNNNFNFLQSFWAEYQQKESTNTFYRDWLKPLFFEALSKKPGQKVSYGHAPFSEKTQEVLQMAPYLNGELFNKKLDVDDQGLWLPDEHIGDFFEFLFQYNFTIEENELYDEELELSPEFLGIIFERLTNMDQGAVYTPREEVDLMCRLSIVKWLEQTTSLTKEDLYHLFFRNAGADETYDEDQKQGDFSPAEIRTLIDKLESVTICDPAAGSGAFEVGMLQVLDQILGNLYTRNNTPEEYKRKCPTPFERKKAIIALSLYGVEVKRWAVWINQLRLWLTLFVDMPDDIKESFEPLLPNLAFKIRTGDSLIQRIAGKTFPVQGHTNLPAGIKRKITLLKQNKRDFFFNKSRNYYAIEHEELDVFQAILDAEISDRQDQIHRLYKTEPEQPELFQTGPEQASFNLDLAEKAKKQRDNFKAEIAELRAQKQALREDRPFIWSIEFAEIFFDRGGFDIVIGNPPYVRQEQITDPKGELSPAEYKRALLEMVRLDFPDYFTRGARSGQFLAGRKPSGRSDIYTYFYIRSLRLLNPGGIQTFICSNSWLDVGYGAWLQEFFIRRVPLHFVIDNHARRSFVQADINTIVTLAGAPQKEETRTVRFVAFKKPFIDVVLSENWLSIENTPDPLRKEEFRALPITTEKLLEEGAERSATRHGRYRGDKWGSKHLRAPDIYYTILEKGKGKLVRLGDVARIRRGVTTGANDFFYLEPLGPGTSQGLMRVRNGAGWEGEIEMEFLKPVIKSPRECHNVKIKPEEIKHRIFMCSKGKEELKGTKALKYIMWGEEAKIIIRQGVKKGQEVTGYSKLSSLRNRKMWWNLSQRKIAGLHFNYLINHVGKTYIGDFYVGDNFHDIYLSKDYATSLNSIIFYLFQNIIGRTSFGGGLLKIQAYELRNLYFLDLKENAPDSVFSGNCNSIFTECGINPQSEIPIAEQIPQPLPDRKALDDIVFDALELTEEERREVYRAVCQLVWERISKARSV